MNQACLLLVNAILCKTSFPFLTTVVSLLSSQWSQYSWSSPQNSASFKNSWIPSSWKHTFCYCRDLHQVLSSILPTQFLLSNNQKSLTIPGDFDEQIFVWLIKWFPFCRLCLTTLKFPFLESISGRERNKNGTSSSVCEAHSPQIVLWTSSPLNIWKYNLI